MGWMDRYIHRSTMRERVLLHLTRLGSAPHTQTPHTPHQDYATLLDIKDQVYSWWDHGLLSAALHPQFPKQPYMFIAVRGARA